MCNKKKGRISQVGLKKNAIKEKRKNRQKKKVKGGAVEEEKKLER